MSDARVGALRVDLALNTAEFTTGAKNAEKSLSGLEKAFDILTKTSTLAGLAIGAAVVTMGTLVASGVSEAIRAMDKLEETSQKVGLTTEAFSQLSYAAFIAGTSTSGLETGLKKLSQALEKMAEGDKTSAAARTFTALGISAVDAGGKLKSSGLVMEELAGKFVTFKDGAGKTALAMNIFGKSGAELIPVLNKGADGIRELSAESDNFGTTINSKTAAAAGKFSEQLDKMAAQMKGVYNRIAEQLLPAFITFTDYFFPASQKADAYKGVIGLVSDAIKVLIATIITADGMMRILTAQIGISISTLARFAQLDFTGGIEAFARMSAETKKISEETNAALSKVWNETTKNMWITTTTVAQTTPPIIQSAKAMSQAQSEYNKLVAEGKELTRQYADPLEKIRLLQEKINRTFAAGTITATTYGRAMAEASIYSRKNMDALASSVTGNLATIFGETKAVAIATALINTYQGITKALADYPPPISFAMAALQAAAGFAQVAKIRSATKSGGGGGGGSSDVGGGAAATATAGATAQQTPAGGTLTVQGITAGQLFSGDVVRAFAERLLEYQKDGGRVVLA